MAKSHIKVKLNKEAFRQLRESPPVRADLERRAKAIAQAASRNGQVTGYQVTDLVLERPRGAVSVMATGWAARDNRKRNSLLKNIRKGEE